MGNCMATPIWVFTVPATLLALYLAIRMLVLRPWGARARYAAASERARLNRQHSFEEIANESNLTFFKINSRCMLSKDDEKKMQAECDEIVALPLEVLREKLQTDQLNASTVLVAYMRKVLDVNKDINCVTGFIRESLLYALEADEQYFGVKEKPPLYGLPFSVKSNFHLIGYDTPVGVGKLLEHPKDFECSLVTELKKLGAIPFVLTNVPQGLLSFSCSNTVYGRTLNPNDHTRVPGGSSGGEAALYVAGGSAFGIGSDLAGSLRIPASMCGCVSLKPTQDRLVVNHSHGGIPGRSRLGLSFGFFTSTVDEQIMLLKRVIGTSSYRSLVPESVPIELDLEKIQDPKKLRFGYFDNDGFCPPVPSHARVVNETIEKLKAAGHECVKFEVPQVQKAAELFFKNVMPDNGAYMKSLFSNEEIDDTMKLFVTLLKVPSWIRWVASKALRWSSPQLALISGAYVSGLEDLRYTNEMTDAYKRMFIDVWKEKDIDALICPAFISPAIGHEFPSKMSMAAFGTGLYNMIDFPAGVVPTGKVTEKDDEAVLDENLFPVGSNVALKELRNAATNSKGLPCSVQIVTLPFEEELCLKAMQLVENEWKQ